MTLLSESNQRIVEALRDTFEPAIERLTPDVEPAVVFLLSSEEDDKEE